MIFRPFYLISGKFSKDIEILAQCWLSKYRILEPEGASEMIYPNPGVNTRRENTGKK